jgi:secreted Zn-dependent insulinase-like peptidase
MKIPVQTFITDIDISPLFMQLENTKYILSLWNAILFFIVFSLSSSYLNSQNIKLVVECWYSCPFISCCVLRTDFLIYESWKVNELEPQNYFLTFVQYLCCLKDGLEEETFEHHKSGLIADKLEKDPSLSYQTGDYWSQIVDKRYNFFLASSAAMDLLEFVRNKVNCISA